MRRVRALLALRLLLIANAVILSAVGGISLAFVERPAGVIGAALCWLAAGGLLGLAPFTDPYRKERRPRPRAGDRRR